VPEVGAQLADLPGWAEELLHGSRVARLGFLDGDDRPRVLPITFAVAEGRLWSAIDDKPKRAGGEDTARVRFLRRRPAAALTVDRYSDDWSELAWVQVLGTVRVRPVGDAAAGLEALRTKYGPYAGSPPPGPMLEIAPRRCLCWRADQGSWQGRQGRAKRS
jgi:PPOX class probable F420-dependent enzyme